MINNLSGNTVQQNVLSQVPVRQQGMSIASSLATNAAQTTATPQLANSLSLNNPDLGLGLKGNQFGGFGQMAPLFQLIFKMMQMMMSFMGMADQGTTPTPAPTPGGGIYDPVPTPTPTPIADG